MAFEEKDLMFEIQIGEVNGYEDGKIHPKTTIPITEREMWIIEQFANVIILSDLHKEYTLNNVKFKIGFYERGTK